jgi:hypothetical protein
MGIVYVGIVLRVALTFVMAALAAAQPRTPVVVELFTSEGCSSCPPADNLLSRLEKNPPGPNIEVIALGEHVDYWNQLGWQDRFSSPAFSARQQEYGRALRLENVYTPEMVVNGQVELLGSDGRRAVREIQQAAQGPRARVEMALVSSDSLRLRVENLPPETREADILLAITENELETNVQRGENSGTQLRHTGVVRSLMRLGRIDTAKAGSYSADAQLKLKPEWRREYLKLVLFVQDRATHKIVGAATLRL